MGEGQEKTRLPLKYKRRLAILLSAFLLITFPVCELMFVAGALPYSPAAALLSYFGADAIDEDSEFIEFVSSGQADCTVIKSGNMTALVDFGLKDESDSLFWHLKELGITSVDLAVITHHHNDHMGGFIDLLEGMEIKNLLISSTSAEDADKELFKEVINAANKKNVKIYTPKIGSNFKIGNAVLEVLYADETAKEENNRSIITRVRFKEKSVLLTGDAEGECEEKLLNTVSDISCDVLKLAHHGSYTSTSYELLERSGTKVAIASSGYDNTYGHPANQVLERLKKYNVTCYRTDLDGNIRCEFGKNSFSVSTEREN